MCTSTFAFGVHPNLLFFLAFNRDEFFDRPTASADWWEDDPDILAGKDLVRGGTWLGVSRKGRFAFLTNFREVQPNNPHSGPSRGELPVSFLRSQSAPIEYLKQLNLTGHTGFNLVVGDIGIGQVAYITNRDSHSRGPIALQKGVYSISNGILSSTWAKTERARTQVQELLQGNIDHSSFSVNKLQESILGSCAKEDDSKLPQTGMPQAVEKEFSSIFIKPTQILGQPYGTHTQTVILGWASNEVEYYERAFIPIADSAVEESDGSAENDKNRTSVHRFSVPITNAWRVGQLG